MNQNDWNKLKSRKGDPISLVDMTVNCFKTKAELTGFPLEIRRIREKTGANICIRSDELSEMHPQLMMQPALFTI